MLLFTSISFKSTHDTYFLLTAKSPLIFLLTILVNPAIMFTTSVTSEKGSEVDEKNMYEVSNGRAVTVAEDTVEAVHQCKLWFSSKYAIEIFTDFIR
jgi:hypothetical protein